MKKILHLYPYINFSCGISRSIASIVSNTAEVFDSSVFCLGGDAIEKYRSEGINIFCFQKDRTSFLGTISIFFFLLSLVRKNNIDILHAHHRYFDLIAYILSKFTKVKMVTSVRSKVYGKRKISYKAPILIACSSAIKEHLINYFNINAAKIIVIHNFTNPSKVKIKSQKQTILNEIDSTNDTTIIGFVGRFSIKEKGVDILLEAYKNLEKLISSRIKLIFVGDGEDKKYIQNYIVDNNLNALVLSPKENIFDYYNVMNIVVMPSRIEPFGNVAIEAGLMRKAFVGSDVDGLREIVDTGINGILIPAGDVKLLTENLKTFIDNSILRNKYGNNLYQKVMDHFTADKIIPLYVAEYRRILEDINS